MISFNKNLVQKKIFFYFHWKKKSTVTEFVNCQIYTVWEEEMEKLFWRKSSISCCFWKYGNTHL